MPTSQSLLLPAAGAAAAASWSLAPAASAVALSQHVPIGQFCRMSAYVWLVLSCACSSRVDQCGAIENGYSTRLEGDAFDALLPG